ncbi:hypothetical protein BSNK01_21360 [Bacillaceae bacterium]
MGKIDTCIMCGRELTPWERIRSECIDCREIATETYSEESESNR